LANPAKTRIEIAARNKNNFLDMIVLL